MTPVLSAFYFGSVEHYRLLATHPKVIIDVGEHYMRQSYRTRTRIIGPNGPQDLCVHIAHDHGKKMPMHQVGLSYAETWREQQLHAIRTAYGKAPWTLHFIDAITELLSRKYDRLIDLDLASMRLGMEWLGLRTEVVVRENYVEFASGGRQAVSKNAGPRTAAPRPGPALHDLRTSFHPKRPLPPKVTAVAPYPQVFADRHGFVPRASVIDLVCNTGPEAVRALGVGPYLIAGPLKV